AVFFFLKADRTTSRKIPEITIVHILPPPPPPPVPPPPPPEPKMVEQVPVKEEMIEQKPIEQKPDEQPPSRLSLDAKGDGPGDVFNLGGKPGGRGLLGGAGGEGGGRWGWYASIVQAQIEAALRANPKTRNATMRVQVRLWCDSSGRINRVQLMSSTGDGTLDA